MAQTLYYGGTILTMEADGCAQAVLVEDGRIAAVGTEAEVFAVKAADALCVDLKGRTMMPSFMDGHSHITALASTLGLVPLEDAASFDDIVSGIVTYIKERRPEPGSFVIGFGYDHNYLAEKRHPDRYVLDAVQKTLEESGINGDYQLMIGHASGHMGVVNSKALAALGIDENTPDPSGGVIGRLADGKTPSGYLEENAFTGMSAQVPRPSAKELMDNLGAAEEIYLSHGITTIQDGLTKAPEWAMLKMMADHHRFRADVIAYVDIKDNAHLVEDNADYDRKYKNHLKIGGYKLFLDGSPQGRTAWMSQPYRDSSHPDQEDPEKYRGYPIYEDAQVDAYVKKAAYEGRQIITHCNGDAACQQLIDACAKADCAPIRPVMIHAQLVRRDQLEEMARLGMIASFFVAHTWYWGDIHWNNFGKERASVISPVKSALRAGVPVTFHQDTPVLMPDMIDTIWCAMNRITRGGQCLDASERANVWDALNAVTTQCAWQYFEEDTKGSIRVGKLADLVILSENPLEVPAADFRQIKVLETIKEGRSVWKAAK